jgi:hypothetical protein
MRPGGRPEAALPRFRFDGFLRELRLKLDPLGCAEAAAARPDAWPWLPLAPYGWKWKRSSASPASLDGQPMLVPVYTAVAPAGSGADLPLTFRPLVNASLLPFGP